MTLTRYLLPFFIAACPTTLASQTIDRYKVNGYFAPLTVIENHPECNGRGDVALRLDLDADDLQVRLDGVHPNDVFFGGGKWPVPDNWQRCFVTQRAAGEVTRVEIPCGDRTPPEGSAWAMQDMAIQLDISGAATLCQSPLGTQLIDGNWRADFTFKDQTQTYEGDYVASTAEYCAAKEGQPNGVAALTHAQSGLIGDAWDVTGPGDTVYRLRLRSLRLDGGRSETAQLTLSADAFFYATLDGAVACHDGICGGEAKQPIPWSSPIGLDYELCR